jgi:aminopeptidase N
MSPWKHNNCRIKKILVKVLKKCRIAPDLQSTVYCTAVASGGDAEWNFIFEQYKEATRDVHQLSLLRALACSKSNFRLNK